MARFNFRLQTLRRLREITRDELRFRLATAYEAERILAQQRAALALEEAELALARRAIIERTPVDVNGLLASQRYQLALTAQGKVFEEQAAKLAAEVELRRAAVVEADREVRVLDKLEERQRRQHEQARAQVEMKRMDEIGATRWPGGDAWAS
jgi:flagellar export protein FliJ